MKALFLIGSIVFAIIWYILDIARSKRAAQEALDAVVYRNAIDNIPENEPEPESEPVSELQTVARTEYPANLEEYIGHRNAKTELQMILSNYHTHNHKVDHILLEGHGGLGKTNLAEIVANSIGCGYLANIGESLKNSKMVDRIVEQLQENTVWFIDEIHNVPIDVVEYMYPIMEKGLLYRKDGAVVEVPAITIIGATTNAEMLPDSFLQRFVYKFYLDRYSNEDIMDILGHCLPGYVSDITTDARKLIAVVSQGIIRPARMEWLKSCANTALYQEKDVITTDIVRQLIRLRGVDEQTGLNKLQLNVLKALSTGTAMGKISLALKVGLEPRKLEEKVEPFLLQNVYIERSPKGRIITTKGMQVVKRIKRKTI